MRTRQGSSGWAIALTIFIALFIISLGMCGMTFVKVRWSGDEGFLEVGGMVVGALGSAISLAGVIGTKTGRNRED